MFELNCMFMNGLGLRVRVADVVLGAGAGSQMKAPFQANYVGRVDL